MRGCDGTYKSYSGDDRLITESDGHIVGTKQTEPRTVEYYIARAKLVFDAWYKGRRHLQDTDDAR